MAQAQASTRQSLQRTDSDWERDMASLKDGSDAKVREALDGARKAWEAQFAKLRADSDGKLRQLLVSTTLFTALHSCFRHLKRLFKPHERMCSCCVSDGGAAGACGEGAGGGKGDSRRGQPR